MKCHQCSSNCGKTTNPSPNKILQFFRQKSGLPTANLTNIPQIALVGMPNVGKSVLFNALTGTYATVSNYPGTTVEVSRGQTVIDDRQVNVIDTPGMYSLVPITEEERVARDLLLKERVNLAIHVLDAKNLARMLPLTFQLIETEIPVLLALNMMDEARQLEIEINQQKLEEELKIPVVTMAVAQGRGVKELVSRMAKYVTSDCLSGAY
ncbi:FeoB small GTPase domain-containing protein [Gloeothece verrucosa]|uniref:Small GTP-binding protein n=1 Tax=Gloeothece verrucosa (strain PCC 7822) TaxID=497965 RepID=E0UCR2_GLOV7|nr:FeoB small GTPase domain-containing protein [Gloeothece verrucosa]ADN15256.1 small GTP-binding protein [Gloeothece verrucosa PCC 7822]